MIGTVADYIVIGAGSAGCVLANRLSANGKHNVLLLEAGPRDRSIWIHLPIGYGKTMFHPVYNWGFYTDPEPTMNGRRIYWPRGRGLGGSSSINGLIYVRGQPQDYDRWAALGNRGWSWQDVLPFFERSQTAVSEIATKHELVDAFIRGANELGIPTNRDFNSGQQEGVGYYQLFTKNGLRSSSATAYLRPARGRANLRVETNAHATRILFEGNRAIGVRYRQNGAEKQARAAREVLLSAGALQSPQLLQLSGVGAPALTQPLGIPFVHDLPGVGENLQDHLQLRVMYRCTKAITTNDDLASLWRRLRIGAQWVFARSGPLAIGINQGALFTKALAESTTPDVQFHFATLSADLAGAKPHPWPGFTMSVCQLRPESRGTVRIRSADAFEAPSMKPNYLSTDLDRRCAVAGVKLARALAATNSMRPYVAQEHRPGASARTDDELLEFARNFGATIFHPSGTCKMGDDAMAVVDDRLRVRGIEGLRVVDCSIMPTLVSGNTHAPAVMIAEKAAEMILEHAASAGPAARGWSIRAMSNADVASVASLLASLAREHITHEFDPRARELFLAKNDETNIREFLAQGFRYHVAESHGRIVGVVGVRDNRHLYHLFVANEFQRRGIARRLWAVAREQCIAAGNPGNFTVNASNNAIPVYERLGFVRSGPAKNDDGIRYNPMAATAPPIGSG